MTFRQDLFLLWFYFFHLNFNNDFGLIGFSGNWGFYAASFCLEGPYQSVYHIIVHQKIRSILRISDLVTVSSRRSPSIKEPHTLLTYLFLFRSFYCFFRSSSENDTSCALEACKLGNRYTKSSYITDCPLKTQDAAHFRLSMSSMGPAA